MDHLKTCPKCREAKPRAEFNRLAKARDGLYTYCKPCNRAQVAAWKQANPEKCREQSRACRKANPEKYREYTRQAQARWSKANPEKVKANAAKQAAKEIKRAHRYLRAFGYFKGRHGWTDMLSASLLREKRLLPMCFKVPALEDYVAELV